MASLCDVSFLLPLCHEAHQHHQIAKTRLAFTRGFPFSPKLWQDAYLAAFAVTADLGLITFDHGFSKFTGLRLEILDS